MVSEDSYKDYPWTNYSHKVNAIDKIVLLNKGHLTQVCNLCEFLDISVKKIVCHYYYYCYYTEFM